MKWAGRAAAACFIDRTGNSSPEVDQPLIPAEETGLRARRRRRNRPGNAQAKGPLGSWHSGKRRRFATSPTDGRNLFAGPRCRGKSLRSWDRGGVKHGSSEARSKRAPLREFHGRACPRRRDAPARPRFMPSMSPLGARMVPFAGYDMPVQYPTGIMTEHNWTREHAGLFDVSHMGQAFLIADDRATRRWRGRSKRCSRPTSSTSSPASSAIRSFSTDDGGILDDLMVTRSARPRHDGRPDAGRQRLHEGRGLRAYRRRACRRA